MAELPGRTLARELIEQSRAVSRQTPMEDVILTARAGTLPTISAFD